MTDIAGLAKSLPTTVQNEHDKELHKIAVLAPNASLMIRDTTSACYRLIRHWKSDRRT